MGWMQEISDTLGIEVSSFKIEEVDKLMNYLEKAEKANEEEFL